GPRLGAICYTPRVSSPVEAPLAGAASDAPLDLRGEVRANLRLAGPIVLSQIGWMAMGLVDTAIVGRVGERELAGVALGNTISVICWMPALGVFLAIEPLAAQAIGARDASRARSVFREG